MNRFFSTLHCLALCCVLLSGCGSGLVDVRGRVTLDGQPLADATVVFTGDGQPMATGQTDAQGRYRLRTGDQPGIAAGTYRVTVSAYRTLPAADGSDEPIPELRTPARYNNAATSGLTAEVGSGQDEFNFELGGEAGEA